TVAPCAASAAGARSIRTQRILPPLYICRGIGNEHWRLRYGALQEPSSDARFPPPHLHRATRNAADPAFPSASRLPDPARPSAGGTEPFAYQSFQWAQDSKHLVFQTHFQPLYRRSGTSDYYVYGLADRALTLAARGARTAELSPGGTLMGYERDGDMFVYDLA